MPDVATSSRVAGESPRLIDCFPNDRGLRPL